MKPARTRVTFLNSRCPLRSYFPKFSSQAKFIHVAWNTGLLNRFFFYIPFIKLLQRLLLTVMQDSQIILFMQTQMYLLRNLNVSISFLIFFVIIYLADESRKIAFWSVSITCTCAHARTQTLVGASWTGALKEKDTNKGVLSHQSLSDETLQRNVSNAMTHMLFNFLSWQKLHFKSYITESLFEC